MVRARYHNNTKKIFTPHDITNILALEELSFIMIRVIGSFCNAVKY